MAVTLKSRSSKNVGTASVLVGNYTAPVAAVIIGLSIANIKPFAVACNVYFSNTSANTALASNVTIPSGAAFVPIGGDQKIILQVGYGIRVSSNTASSLDAVLSVMEKS